jgi:hypothetical protein
MKKKFKQQLKHYRSGYLMDTTDPLDFGTCFAVAFSALSGRKLEEVLGVK